MQDARYLNSVKRGRLKVGRSKVEGRGIILFVEVMPSSLCPRTVCYSVGMRRGRRVYDCEWIITAKRCKRREDLVSEGWRG